MMEPGRANCIPRDSLLQLMKDHSEVAVGVGEQLRRLVYRTRGGPHLGFYDTPGREACQAPPILDDQCQAKRWRRRFAARQTDSQPRRDRTDHRGYPSNGQSSPLRVQQAAGCSSYENRFYGSKTGRRWKRLVSSNVLKRTIWPTTGWPELRVVLYEASNEISDTVDRE
jgi:hypothetical protein